MLNRLRTSRNSWGRKKKCLNSYITLCYHTLYLKVFLWTYCYNEAKNSFRFLFPPPSHTHIPNMSNTHIDHVALRPLLKSGVLNFQVFQFRYLMCCFFLVLKNVRLDGFEMLFLITRAKLMSCGIMCIMVSK